MEKDFLEFKVQILREKPGYQSFSRQIDLMFNPDSEAWIWVVTANNGNEKPIQYGPVNSKKFCSAQEALVDLKAFLTLWCDRALSTEVEN
ncbi:MAG: hypothetical protein KatS3mg087_0577 [Patescibacteria group bacterium]|nr:MAG: hypothetical protein KatS3mg087_0577 [Patescibacteria group bacterium]